MKMFKLYSLVSMFFLVSFNHCYSQTDSSLKKTTNLIQYVDSIPLRASAILNQINTTRGLLPADSQELSIREEIKKIKNEFKKTLKDLDNKRTEAYIELSNLTVPLPQEDLNQKKATIEFIYKKGRTDAEVLFNQKVDILLTAKSVFFLPARSSFTASKFYTGSAFKPFQLLNNTSLSASFENGAFQNEIAASFFGPFRGSFNTILSKQKQTKIDNSKVSDLNQQQLRALIQSTDSLNRSNSTLMKIAAGGGEFGFNLKTPILNFNGDKQEKFLAFQTEFVANITSDLPIAGSYIEKSQLSFFYLAQLQNKLLIRPSSFDGTTKKPGEFYIYAIYNGGIVGGLKKFYENLSIENGKQFIMHDFLFGVTFKNFGISYTYQTFSVSELKGRINGRLGLSFVNSF